MKQNWCSHKNKKLAQEQTVKAKKILSSNRIQD